MEPVDKPARGVGPDLRPQGGDGVPGVIGPREYSDHGLPGAGLYHLLDHRVVTHHRRPAHRRKGELHLFTELFAQCRALIRDLSLENEVEQRNPAPNQGQAGAEHEADGEGKIAPPESAERQVHYRSSTFTSVVR